MPIRILYAIQGTGNGHLSRATVFVPALQRRPGVSVDVAISGGQCDLQPPFPIRYRLHGLGFVFGQRGGIDLRRTLSRTAPLTLARESRRLPLTDYDLVVNDFEPVTAWAARRAVIPCVALSHQYAVAHPCAPGAARLSRLAQAFLHWYAPTTEGVGFHFERYAEDLRFPIIRTEIRNATVTDAGHYTVYLPAYSAQRILAVLSALPAYRFEVFVKGLARPQRHGNVWLRPVNGKAFVASMAAAAGVCCGAGFETPSEAIYLGKKLLVVPMRGQFEQVANAEALARMGVGVLPEFSVARRPDIERWLVSGRVVHRAYPDETEKIVERVLAVVGKDRTAQTHPAVPTLRT